MSGVTGVLLAMYGEEGSPSPPAPLPGDEDLQGAAQALVRLHHVYRCGHEMGGM